MLTLERMLVKEALKHVKRVLNMRFVTEEVIILFEESSCTAHWLLLLALLSLVIHWRHALMGSKLVLLVLLLLHRSTRHGIWVHVRRVSLLD